MILFNGDTPYQDMVNNVVCGDTFEAIKKIPTKSIDMVCTDPPYGIMLDEWDQPINIPYFVSQVSRILKDDGFFVWFGQMPTMIDWINESNKRFKFLEHVVWVKRAIAPSGRLARTHESFFVYSKGNTEFKKLKGRYEDVKIPGILYDTYTIEGLKRYVSSLHYMIGSKTPHTSNKRGKSSTIYSRFKSHQRINYNPEVNFTNVWSFLPAQKKTLNKEEQGHPTQKPLAMIERIIEMLTIEGATVCDPFMGSWTTAHAAQNLKREFIGFELSQEFCQYGENRLFLNHNNNDNQ